MKGLRVWSLNLNVADKNTEYRRTFEYDKYIWELSLETIQIDIFYMKISMVWFVVLFKVTDTWRMQLTI